MTTNQTIDGVPRRVCHACVTYPRESYCSVCDPVARPPSIFTSQFLTDVMTASGLVAHGKRDKKFAERLADECSLVRSALYAKQPAPVVLPERMPLEKPEHHTAPVEIHNGVVTGWNACLDEIERLNPARPVHANPPPGTEPCGTHHDNDGLDEWRK